MRSFVNLVLLVAGIGLVLPAVAHALVIPKDVDQLAVEADQIVTGKVVSIQSAWAADSSEIYTDVTLAVESVIKGATASAVRLRLPGGTVGEETMAVSDTPYFETGERVLVFLKADDEGIARVWGWFQGKYSLQKDQAVNETLQVTLPFKELAARIETALR